MEKPFIGNWEKQLTAVMVSESSRVPAHWLANGPGKHASVTEALWSLRDQMMRDSLGISNGN